MGRGRRYNNDEPKLNIKKVIAVIVAVAVIVMAIVGIVKLVHLTDKQPEKSVALKYYTAYSEEKYGVINSKGETIISPQYDEMIMIPDNTKDVFLCTYDVDYAQETYKTKAVNAKGETLFSQYEKVEVLSNIDNQNNIWMEADVLKAEKEGKYGLIDLKGNEILPCAYEEIMVLTGVKNSLLTKQEGKMGLVDNTGTIIIPNEYEEITAVTNEYADGYIVKTVEGKYGVITPNKTQVLQPVYDKIENVYGNNMYAVEQDGTKKIVDNKEKTVIEGGYEEVKEIHTQYITIKKDGKYGVISAYNQEVIPCEYEELQYVAGENYIAKKDGKYGIVNTSNETKIAFEYTQLLYRKEANILEGQKEGVNSELIDSNLQVRVTGIVSEFNPAKGYMKIREGSDYKYYNFNFEEKMNTEILKGNTLFLKKENGKYGYVNANGIVVVNYEYDDAKEQNEFGYAAVKKDGKWGAIDAKGNVVVQPKYTLENQMVIDFIGKWYLGEDLNANYYTDR